MQHHDTPEKDYNLERLVFLTDGVFAIVITLLAIELHPPENWDRTFAGLWHEEWRSLVAYAVSFVAAGMFWNANRLLFGRIVRFHTGLVFFNLLLLGLVVLLPFAATLIFEGGPRGEPVLIYLGLIALIAAAQALLWGFAYFVAKVVDPRFNRQAALILLLSMIAAPVLITFIALQVSAGRPITSWIWLLPLMAGLRVLRKRVLARAEVEKAA